MVKGRLEKRLEELKEKAKALGCKPIDIMVNGEKKEFVDYYFNKWGKYVAESPEFYKLIEKMEELGFSSLQEASRYKKNRSRRR